MGSIEEPRDNQYLGLVGFAQCLSNPLCIRLTPNVMLLGHTNIPLYPPNVM